MTTVLQREIPEESGRGGGQVVSLFAFYYNDPSSNPVEVFSFNLQIVWKERKMKNKKKLSIPKQ